MSVTLADVARAAGVSTATASVALNGKAGVSESTRNRIRAIAESLGYRPSSVGRALRQSRTGMVGLYMPNTASSFGYYTEVTRGVADALHAHGLSLLVLPSAHETGAIDRYPDVDGYILVEPHAKDRGVPAILGQSLPVVSGDRPPPGTGEPWGLVESPNRESTRAVFDRFLGRDARRPGLILIERVSTWALDLENAYLQWCVEHGLAPRVIVVRANTGNAKLMSTLAEWFAPSTGTDAVLVGGDGIAVRIAGLLRAMGHDLGESVLLASGVDSTLMEFHTPRVTAVDLQPRHFGAVCADLLVELLPSPRPATPVRRMVAAPIRIRESG